MSQTHQRVRLYHQVRTAHLERAAQLPQATIVYGGKRYDFEDALARQLDLVQARGLRAALYLFRHDIDVLEVNEPLFIHAARSTAVALLGVRARRLLGRGGPRLVTYAIENLDPNTLPRPRSVKSQVARRLDLLLMRVIWGQLDRIVYGTRAAETLYAGLRSRQSPPATTVIEALPAAARGVDGTPKDASRVLFVGDLSDRKGFRQLMTAWPLLRQSHPQARLTVIGKGTLHQLAEECADADPSIQLILDPPRELIRDHLDRAQILVLPSQPTRTWREQVGLPIVEALSYGCTVVTTTETGLAPWLAEHGHQVVGAPTSAATLAAGLSSALEAPLPVASVLRSLPDEDGRLAADRWLFEDHG
ncbi:MAG TPA: glycosyltransferase [Propionibacteriaceae bacterium]